MTAHPSAGPATRRNAIVLLSGGLDSTTTLAIARDQGFALHALSFRYGQRHAVELDCARRVAQAFGVERHLVVEIDLRVFGASALTSDLPVPKDRPLASMSQDIPLTYVPARNTIFLSYALAWSEVLPAADVFIGVNVLDYSGYPDCRPEFIEAFERMARLGTRAGVEGRLPLAIHTPLIDLSKAEIIRRGLKLGVDYSMTTSCYDPSPEGEACGRCDACQLRRAGFVELGLTDPGAYQSGAPGSST
jgi:7-cyano-7-deazaguanine synthase